MLDTCNSWHARVCVVSCFKADQHEGHELYCSLCMSDDVMVDTAMNRPAQHVSGHNQTTLQAFLFASTEYHSSSFAGPACRSAVASLDARRVRFRTFYEVAVCSKTPKARVTSPKHHAQSPAPKPGTLELKPL